MGVNLCADVVRTCDFVNFAIFTLSTAIKNREKSANYIPQSQTVDGEQGLGGTCELTPLLLRSRMSKSRA